MQDWTCCSCSRKPDSEIDAVVIFWIEIAVTKIDGKESAIKFHLCPGCNNAENREATLKMVVTKETYQRLTGDNDTAN